MGRCGVLFGGSEASTFVVNAYDVGLLLRAGEPVPGGQGVDNHTMRQDKNPGNGDFACLSFKYAYNTAIRHALL